MHEYTGGYLYLDIGTGFVLANPTLVHVTVCVSELPVLSDDFQDLFFS